MALPLSPINVTAVVLNFRGAEDTLFCLQALAAMPDRPGHVVVVENGSDNDSLEDIQRWLRLRNPSFFLAPQDDAGQVRPPAAARHALLPLSANNGYAAGNNAGITLALRDQDCRAVWILNNDTEPQPGALENLCGALNESAVHAGLAGSTLVYAHAPNRVQCAGGFSINTLLGTTKGVHGGKTTSDLSAEASRLITKKLDYISGASLLVRREVLETIGLFAEEYFLYYEDAEFSLRARSFGWKLVWARESLVWHKEGGSSGAATESQGRPFARPEIVDYLALRNRIYLMRGYFPSALPVAIASYSGVMLKRIFRGQANRIPLVFKALWHGLTGQLGKPEWLGEPEPHQDAKSKSGNSLQTSTQRTVLFLSARADFGGGPEHLWQLLRHMPQNVLACVACPRDFPYYERFCAIVGEENMFDLPHRKFSIAALWRLRNFCKHRGIAVLHSHGKGAGVYGRLLALFTGRPCVHTFHGVHMAEYGPFKKMAYRFYERCMALFTRMAITISNGERQQIVKEGLIPKGKLRLIPNGVSVPDLPAPLPAGNPYHVISMSRFDYQKNSTFLIPLLLRLKQLDRIEDFRFILIGEGSEKAVLNEQLHVHNLERFARFTGALLDPALFFSEALCYFSSSRWEGMPMAVLEAMAHGLPPVASDVVGNRDAVANGKTGLLYAEGDAVAAADALCRLVDEPDLRLSLGKQARNFVAEECDVRHLARQTWDAVLSVGFTDTF